MLDNLTYMSSMISKLSIFLCIIAGNYVGDIYSCSLRHLFNEYMFLKHIIGFFIMLFFVGLIQNEVKLYEKVGQSLFLYFWFIIIMRAPMIITLIVILAIASIYIIYLYIEDLNKEINKNEDNKQVIDNKINYYNNLVNIIFILSLILSVGGFIFNIITLKKNMKNKFNTINYILGSRDQECFTPEVYKKFIKDGITSDIKNTLTNITPSKDFIPLKLKKKLNVYKK
jgi:hypothetical protein